MLTIAITGSSGFVGKNLLKLFESSYNVIKISYTEPIPILVSKLACADVLIHLGAVQRPNSENEFYTSNVIWTRLLYGNLTNKTKKVIFASTQYSDIKSKYLRSKIIGEKLTLRLTKRGIDVCVIRFPNMFGMYGRPNHTSVVHTFIYAMAHSLPICINNVDKIIKLSHVDSVIGILKDFIENHDSTLLGIVEPVAEYQISLGDIFVELFSIHNARTTTINQDLRNKLISAYDYYKSTELK